LTIFELHQYRYDWPFWTLLAAYTTDAGYQLFVRKVGREQRIFDSSLAALLKELRDLVLKCPDHNSQELIQAAALSVVVDKTKQVTLERRSGIISANLMVADDQRKVLRQTVFDRATQRSKTESSYEAPGPGLAIKEMRQVYIADTRAPDSVAMFPNTPYRSVLSIPLGCGHRKLGVVNVDSEERDAFDEDDLGRHLDPYVQLIGLSLCLR